MAARRRRLRFFKIEVRPRSCRSYHIWWHWFRCFLQSQWSAATYMTVWTVNDVLSRSILFYWVDPYPQQKGMDWLKSNGMDRLNKRLSIDSRCHWWSTLYYCPSAVTNSFSKISCLRTTRKSFLLEINLTIMSYFSPKCLRSRLRLT